MRDRRHLAAALLAAVLALSACGTSGREVGLAPAAPAGSASGPSTTTSSAAKPDDQGSGASSPDQKKPDKAPQPSTSAVPPSPAGPPTQDPDEGEPDKKTPDGKTPDDRTPDDEPSDATSVEPIDPDADENAQPTKKGKQEPVLNRVEGTSASECVKVGSGRDVRAGEFLAGPFDDARAAYGKRRPGLSKHTVRIYFVPLHAGKTPGLTAKFTHVASGETVTTEQDQIADAEQWKFYDTYTELQRGGTWRVRAVAGDDEGCFEFKLPKK